MPRVSDKVVLDANAMTYLNEVLNPSYAPDEDVSDLRDDRIALMRLYLHLDDIPWIVPTIEAEYQRIKAVGLLRSHTDLAYAYLNEPGDDEALKNSAKIIFRVDELLQDHPQEADCRVVAEAEAIGGDAVLTCDHGLLQHLAGVVKIGLFRPSQFWTRLGLPRGRRPPREVARRIQGDRRWWDW